MLEPPKFLAARWAAIDAGARGAILVSVGSFVLVVMALLVKVLAQRVPALEILFFRSTIGFLFILPLFARDPLEPLRTKRPGMHLLRGLVGTGGNICFFWTLTHLLLADAMALQFSRPLFMIPLAMLFLGEMVGMRRAAITCAGFAGILIYARPFTAGFEPGVFVGAAGALFGGLVVICIKKLSSTESTRVIMFYYAFWTAAFSAIPAMFVWVTPSWPDLAMLVVIAIMGMSGQGMITHGFTLGDATALVPLDYGRLVYSAFFGYFLFGEIPSAWSLAGMAIIVAASLALVLGEIRRRSRR
ncbi:MAG: DMT family transporter [Alphaproteobacteria bacterium]|nr:DMT family transporter [Alphaproteobacteria bacterium]